MSVGCHLYPALALGECLTPGLGQVEAGEGKEEGLLHKGGYEEGGLQTG